MLERVDSNSEDNNLARLQAFVREADSSNAQVRRLRPLHSIEFAVRELPYGLGRVHVSTDPVRFQVHDSDRNDDSIVVQPLIPCPTAYLLSEVRFSWPRFDAVHGPVRAFCLVPRSDDSCDPHGADQPQSVAGNESGFSVMFQGPETLVDTFITEVDPPLMPALSRTVVSASLQQPMVRIVAMPVGIRKKIRLDDLLAAIAVWADGQAKHSECQLEIRWQLDEAQILGGCAVLRCPVLPEWIASSAVITVACARRQM